MINSAFAQASASAPDPLMSFLPLILMFVVLYFLMIRPQMKRAKEHKLLVEGLQKNDEVITNSGLVGKITTVYWTKSKITVRQWNVNRATQ